MIQYPNVDRYIEELLRPLKRKIAKLESEMKQLKLDSAVTKKIASYLQNNK